MLAKLTILRSLIAAPLSVVGFVTHLRNIEEVLCKRRRLRLPFESSCLPRIVAADCTVFERPAWTKEWKHIADANDAGTCRGHGVEALELPWIRMIPARSGLEVKEPKPQPFN